MMIDIYNLIVTIEDVESDHIFRVKGGDCMVKTLSEFIAEQYKDDRFLINGLHVELKETIDDPKEGR